MRKYIIEVSEEGIKKTFTEDDGTVFEENWVCDEDGECTEGACITAQLDQYGDFDQEELLELLDQDDIEGLWEFFRTN